MLYLTADTHFHKESLNTLLRPYKNAYEMSLDIIDKINSKVNKNDRLIICGDFSDKQAHIFRNKIICKNCICLIGNHDCKNNLIEAFGINNIRDTHFTKCKEQDIFLSHYAHAYWDKSHHGSFHGYGHTHAQREETLNTLFPERRSIDVGLDNAKIILGDYIPFSEQEIYDILSIRKGHDDIQFYKDFQGEYLKSHETK